MTKHVGLVATMFASLMFAGCASTSVQNKGSGEGNPEDLLVTEQVGPNDLTTVAQAIKNRMLASPNLRPTNGTPLLVRVQPFDNQTGETTFLMNELVDTVVSELTDPGKIQAITDDPAAYETWLMKQKLKGGSAGHLEDYTLTGRVTLAEEVQGNKRQYTYYFNFKMNDTNTGTMAMNGQTRIIKLKKRGGLGF